MSGRSCENSQTRAARKEWFHSGRENKFVLCLCSVLPKYVSALSHFASNFLRSLKTHQSLSFNLLPLKWYFSISTYLSSWCSPVKNSNPSVFWWFWSSGLSVNVSPEWVLMWIMTMSSFTGFSHLYRVIHCCSRLHLHFSLNSTSISGRNCLLPEQYDGCVLPWCWELRIIAWTDKHGIFWIEAVTKDGV